jgi:hypothetical protein
VTAADFALIGITPASVAVAITWGFGVVLSSWSVGYVVGLAVGLIKKI